ncbi:MAG TPA: PEP/pyruvate-binding domain-containing protein [Chloroflexota bacterium]|nr:PEP/pyruvate-binding domain-containing protein [Chloroflexota bacterium]
MTSTIDQMVLWLDEPGSIDVALVGGKAANLSVLAGRFPVPPGFTVTTPALAGGMNERGSRLSPDLRDAISRAYAALGAGLGSAQPPVAVRSSGVDEDAGDAAFAGQFETLLNISGPEAVCEAVEACWASARSERVAAYRRTHGGGDGAVAVLVQSLVPADSAAVAFSVNPVTGDRGVVAVNANYGLGESIVAGTVTPDSYLVRKSDLTPVDVRIGSKQRMTVRTAGGTREVGVPALLRSVAVLDDRQLAEVARLAIDLEAAMWRPVDIECAYAGGILYLLQCRPVTTLG